MLSRTSLPRLRPPAPEPSLSPLPLPPCLPTPPAAGVRGLAQRFNDYVHRDFLGPLDSLRTAATRRNCTYSLRSRDAAARAAAGEGQGAEAQGAGGGGGGGGRCGGASELDKAELWLQLQARGFQFYYRCGPRATSMRCGVEAWG